MFNGLQKKDLYRIHQMTRDFDGGCFSVDIQEIILENDKQVYQLIDAAGKLDGLHPITESWRKLSYDDAVKTLHWGFQNDLAYSTSRLGKKKTMKYSKLILEDLNPGECQCFTNWTDDPWKEGAGRSWMSVSIGTFDIAVVLLDKQKLVFTYLISED